MSDALWTRPAVDLAELIATGQVTSREVVEAAARPITPIDPAWL